MIRCYLTSLFKWLIVVLSCVIFVVQGLAAAEIALEQKQALVQKIEAINQGLEVRDIRPLVEALPPRFYQEMARRLVRKAEELQDEFASSLQQQFDSDGMNHYRFNVETISYHESKAGGLYALVPSQIGMRDAIHDFYTLAVYDEGWYLMPGGQKTVQNPVFLEIYPYLGEITMPPNQITKVSAGEKP